MAILIDHEAFFDVYCPLCKYKDLPDSEDPCDICLEYPSNEYSHRPRLYEKARKQNGTVNTDTKQKRN